MTLATQKINLKKPTKKISKEHRRISKARLIAFAVLFIQPVIFGQQLFAKPVLVKSEQEISEYKLDNGLRIVLAPNQKENKVYMNTIYFTGSLNDPEGKGGLANLIENLAFKGTQNIPGEEYQRQLDQYTLSNNASTDYYSTRYTNLVRPDQTAIDKVLELEAERMDKLVLKAQYVPAEIAIVRREREIRLDQPFSVLLDQMWKSAYGNRSLGRLPIGDLEELKSIKMPELQQFYQDYYAPNNAVVLLTGKFDSAEVLASIDQHFSPLKARNIPQPIDVPVLDSTQISTRHYQVKKGSDLAQFHIFLNGANEKIQPALALAPYLYTMQPSGQLYQNMVKTGVSTDVFGSSWLEPDFNLIFLGAVYAPSQDAEKVNQTLTTQVEQPKQFTEAELQRVKNLFKNEQRQMMASATDLGSALTSYIVSERGDWQRLFVDEKAVHALTLDQVNQTLTQFLTPAHRVTASILPTPEEQKNAQQLAEQSQSPDQAAPLAPVSAAETALLDPSVYQAQIANYVKASAQKLGSSEKAIQRGKLRNGMQYALYPTTTKDDRIYASIDVDFGDANSLMNQGTVIDLTAYLLMRGSKEYSLQQIMDKSIELDGQASVKAQRNSFEISISANKANFAEYFDFVVDLLKNPTFSQSEFDLIKAQSLQSLDRPYTEPEVVAGLTLDRLTEQYPVGDLRYHFEPKVAEQQLQKVTNAQIQQFYQQYFAMNHARISVTGEFDAKKMKDDIKDAFQNWSTKQHFEAVAPDYQMLSAQQVHALSEQREFGFYQSALTLPVGVYHQDAPALIVFAHILGDSQLSSRLAKELREKNGLVYGFGSPLQLHSKKDNGELLISANYTAGRSAQVSQAVHKVLKALLEKGITEQELASAKADIMKQRATILEDDRIIHRMLNGQLENDQSMIDRAKRDQEIVRLTVKDVNTAIKKYIKLDQFVEVMA
ncbi:MAG: insulinase family protein, partial [Pseudomonadota bacterium]|nr:insulinase family protein [Pseudomonadota bacterium]